MKYIVYFLLVTSFLCAEESLLLSSERQENGNIKISVQLPESLDGQIWDTYMYFESPQHYPTYITTEGNSLAPKVLGMLPQQLELSPKYWRQGEDVNLTVLITKSNTLEILASAECSFVTERTNDLETALLPNSPQIDFVQIFDEEGSRYSDYKQFDSRWKSDRMGQSDGTTIGKDGCAMSSAGNIIGWTPRDLNNHLKSNGGYTGNLIIWTKVPYLSYAGQKSLSSSLFGSYHVIGYVGGHFVLLTGAKSGGYGSNDPGKSTNPIYTPGQIYSTRCYSK